ncbi:MAG: hypothetical protein GY786_06355 [Proteobacteria bacterium]|nr:hypothetical protein [Pseudomonadota bacterium]
MKLLQLVHFSLYGVIFIVIASGMATSHLSGAGEVLFFGSSAPLPADFGIYWPNLIHRIFTKILVGLIFIHVAGVLYYKFTTDSSVSNRMWFGKQKELK